MPVPAYRNNIIHICDYLIEQGFTDVWHAGDLTEVPGFCVDQVTKQMMIHSGILKECRSGYYVDPPSYRVWRDTGGA